jgi:PAS domain-containing protein
MAEAEYRSLFENAVCGIYRDKLDSTPVRCNPALAVLNGYQNEAEYIHAVTGAHGAWYVDPGRSDEFKRLMREEGRVKDFVSQSIAIARGKKSGLRRMPGMSGMPRGTRFSSRERSRMQRNASPPWPSSSVRQIWMRLRVRQADIASCGKSK